MKFEKVITINRPVEKVFSYIATDFAKNHVGIDRGLIKAEPLTEGPIRIGSQFRVITAAFIKTIDISGPRYNQIEIGEWRPNLADQYESIIESREYEANKLFSYSSKGRINHITTFSFLSEGNGTQLTISVEAMLSGFFQKLIWLLFARQSNKTTQKLVSELKTIIEANS